jgi:hypothetical protein
LIINFAGFSDPAKNSIKSRVGLEWPENGTGFLVDKLKERNDKLASHSF